MDETVFKEVLLTEEQIKDPSQIAAALFGDVNDPRSIYYPRKLNRPVINWLRLVLWILCPPVVTGGLIWGLLALDLPAAAAIWIPLGMLGVFVFCCLKRMAVCLVKLYQHFAPDSIRKKCRFEPSCSEYMLLSLEKYGFWKGVFKGLNRLKRCNHKDGGFDFP